MRQLSSVSREQEVIAHEAVQRTVAAMPARGRSVRGAVWMLLLLPLLLVAVMFCVLYSPNATPTAMPTVPPTAVPDTAVQTLAPHDPYDSPDNNANKVSLTNSALFQDETPPSAISLFEQLTRWMSDPFRNLEKADLDALCENSSPRMDTCIDSSDEQARDAVVVLQMMPESPLAETFLRKIKEQRGMWIYILIEVIWSELQCNHAILMVHGAWCYALL